MSLSCGRREIGTPGITLAERMRGASGAADLRLPVLRDPLEQPGLASAETRRPDHKMPHSRAGHATRRRGQHVFAESLSGAGLGPQHLGFGYISRAERRKSRSDTRTLAWLSTLLRIRVSTKREYDSSVAQK